MNLIVYSGSIFIPLYFYIGNIYFAFSIAITVYFAGILLLKSDSVFAFREWSLFLYSLNYLFSPAVTYQIDQSLVSYPMKIDYQNYFDVAIPGFLCFYVGIYLFKTRIFIPNIIRINTDSERNKPLLVIFVVVGVALKIFSNSFPSDLGFFFYLASSIRFVGAFSLFALKPNQNWFWVLAVLLIEFYFGAIQAMYHDAVMWILFFAIFCAYILKPTLIRRLMGVGLCIFFILFIQGLKGAYRSKIWESHSSDLSLIIETSSEIKDEITTENNLLGSLSRGNQAWIFASTMNRMDQIGDFQGLHILGIYIESALLPRFLAPYKLKSGDKKIFNTFSGHHINENTSMGLGVFADGYIAYGYWGVMFFTMSLGLLFSLTFLVIEGWAKSSEFYILLVLPILNYAVRPDCELQTIINHIVKGMFVFGLIVTLTKYSFVLVSNFKKKSLV
jgi:hypothetical protein